MKSEDRLRMKPLCDRLEKQLVIFGERDEGSEFDGRNSCSVKETAGYLLGEGRRQWCLWVKQLRDRRAEATGKSVMLGERYR